MGALRRVTPLYRWGRETPMQRMVHDYLRALEAGAADRAAALFIPDGCVESPFLGRLPVKEFVKKVADSSRGTKLTVHDVLVSAEGHLRAVAYYQYDWRLGDGSRVAFDCADVSTSIRAPATSSRSCSFTTLIRSVLWWRTSTPDARRALTRACGRRRRVN